VSTIDHEFQGGSEDIVGLLHDLGDQIRIDYVKGVLDPVMRELVDDMLGALIDRGDGATAFGRSIIADAAARLVGAPERESETDMYAVMVGGSMAAALAIRNERLARARAWRQAKASPLAFRGHTRNWAYVRAARS
jgi:hypothetical protein